AFNDFYTNLLGIAHHKSYPINDKIIKLSPVLSDDQARILIADTTHKEIKSALFSILGSKAPGPDGYNSSFFKASWSILGNDIYNEIQDFFKSRKQLKKLNCTKLTIIPKVSHSQYISELRPIACCNTLYKFITKLICSRMKIILPVIISPNQSNFVEGSQIVHNISVI
ncbi:hypothetical protein RDABS01_012890, partial [Bienertia sinuspersici]